MSGSAEVTFTDEVMSGGGVFRRYSDGVEEWRWRDPAGVIWWRDNRGRHGADEPLRGALIKRTHLDGRVAYGRDAGFGFTVWSDGRRTLNVTNSPAGLVALLVQVGGRALHSVVPAPPAVLTPTEEARLRSAARPRGTRERDRDDEWTRDDHTDDYRDDFG